MAVGEWERGERKEREKERREGRREGGRGEKDGAGSWSALPVSSTNSFHFCVLLFYFCSILILYFSVFQFVFVSRFFLNRILFIFHFSVFQE